MKYYSIGDICRILDVKPHVVRYWEQEIPTLVPRKNRFGTRMYTRRDLQTYLRVKHLLYKRRYTIDGARNRILEEMSEGRADQAARIECMRESLLRMLESLEDLRKKTDSLDSLCNDGGQS